MTAQSALPRALIYGAYGYTGALVLRAALRRGLRPVVAGRDAQRVAAAASPHGLTWAALSLDDADALAAALRDVDVVLHCAGPYSRTSAQMVQACLDTGTHYLDLTGEAEVFDAVYARHDDAVTAGVALVPGVGFDVVPTDHLVATLAQQLPSAVRADIAMVSRGGFSRGTLITAVLGMAEGNRIRSSGRIQAVPLCHRRITVELPQAISAVVASTPLGDLSCAARSVGLPDVTTFTVIPGAAAVRLLDRPLRAALRQPRILKACERLLDWVPGPSTSRLEGTRSAAWVRLYDTAGASVTLAVEVPNTYAFTASSMVHAALVLPGRQVVGALAPSSALGTDFIKTIPGIDLTYRQHDPAPA